MRIQASPAAAAALPALPPKECRCGPLLARTATRARSLRHATLPFAQKLRGGAIAIERVGGTTASGAMSIIQPLDTEPNPRIRQHTRGDIGGV